MKLTSMKRSPAERKADAEPTMADVPDYPWGLQITLGEEDLQQLGLDAMPRAGGPVALEAVATVTSVGEEEVDGKPHRRIQLQITDLALAMSGDDTAGRMYPARSRS